MHWLRSYRRHNRLDQSEQSESALAKPALTKPRRSGFAVEDVNFVPQLGAFAVAEHGMPFAYHFARKTRIWHRFGVPHEYPRHPRICNLNSTQLRQRHVATGAINKQLQHNITNRIMDLMCFRTIGDRLQADQDTVKNIEVAR